MTGRQIKAVVALDYGIDPHSVEAILPVASNVQVVGMVEGLERGFTVLEETNPDMLMVACQGYSERALYLIEGATEGRPDRPIVVLFFGSPDGFMERVFEAGADDLITLPAPAEDVRFALEKAVARKRGSSVASAVNPMICVLGPKGGTGKTLTSCNLAVALAQAGKSSVLVDLDLQFGDVGIALGLSPDRTIFDLAQTGGSIDVDKVDSFLMDHSSGAKVLLAPSRPDQAAAVRDARRAVAEGHEARARDARADGLRSRLDPARAQPRRLEDRDRPGGRPGDPRASPRRAGPERPRDPACDHRWTADRARRRPVGSRAGVQDAGGPLRRRSADSAELERRCDEPQRQRERPGSRPGLQEGQEDGEAGRSR
jgi:hypothetical protein